MTIIEALRTKKPLRRPLVKFMGSNGDGYLGHAFVMSYLLHGPYASGLTLSVQSKPSYALAEEDILAGDWEIQEHEPEKPISQMTRKELEEMVSKAMKENKA